MCDRFNELPFDKWPICAFKSVTSFLSCIWNIKEIYCNAINQYEILCTSIFNSIKIKSKKNPEQFGKELE